MKKKTSNGALIKQNMDLTFAFRRNEVVKDKPDITQICQRWPALFTERYRFEGIDMSHMLHSTEPFCCHQRGSVVLIKIVLKSNICRLGCCIKRSHHGINSFEHEHVLFLHVSGVSGVQQGGW